MRAIPDRLVQLIKPILGSVLHQHRGEDRFWDWLITLDEDKVKKALEILKNEFEALPENWRLSNQDLELSKQRDLRIVNIQAEDQHYLLTCSFMPHLKDEVVFLKERTKRDYKYILMAPWEIDVITSLALSPKRVTLPKELKEMTSTGNTIICPPIKRVITVKPVVPRCLQEIMPKPITQDKDEQETPTEKGKPEKDYMGDFQKFCDDHPADPQIKPEITKRSLFARRRVATTTPAQPKTNDPMEFLRKARSGNSQGYKVVDEGEARYTHSSEIKSGVIDIDAILRKGTNIPPSEEPQLLLALILVNGLLRGASDAHINPNVDAMEVLFRIDGDVHFFDDYQHAFLPPLMQIIKVLIDGQITRLNPQSGDFVARYDGTDKKMRVEICPCNQHFNEKNETAVIRFLPDIQRVPGLIEIFQIQTLVDLVQRKLALKNGMILVTGITGSGKTTTLASMVQELKSKQGIILTLEDPIEIVQIGQGIRQYAANEKMGRTFPVLLRSAMRQDPDTILCGEIRDIETAQIACQASQTGHLVLSTTHTSNTLLAIIRLLNLEVPPCNLEALELVINQNLEPRVRPDGERSGRVVTAEFLDPNQDIFVMTQAMLRNQCTMSEIRNYALENKLLITRNQHKQMLEDSGILLLEGPVPEPKLLTAKSSTVEKPKRKRNKKKNKKRKRH